MAMDRDLYQAQMALERAANTAEAEELRNHVAIFDENVRQTTDRFVLYRERTAGLDQAATIAAYLGHRENWLTVAQTLLDTLPAGAQDPRTALLVTQSISTFAEMRFALDRLTESVVNPLIQSTTEAMAVQARDARRAMLVTLVVALVIGSSITLSGVIGIRRQYREMVVERDQRVVESQRKDFERRVHNAFELVQSEESALKVIEDILHEVVGEGQQSEVLLADPSIAHLRRVCGTTPADEKGCKALEPGACPAIRRNSQLDFKRDSTFDVCPHLRKRVEAGCSATCMPINILGRTMGVLHTLGPQDRLPTSEQQQKLRALASDAGSVLGMLRAFATKDQQANTDSLTGLSNRRSLEANMRVVAARGVYAAAFCDIDHFKQLNDTYGHDAGDKALRLFSDVLRASLRPDDLIARWGGEEFVIVLPDSVDAKALGVLDRIRERLQEMLAIAAVPRFTASFGVSDSRNGATFDDVVAAADKALMRAKKEGRDRIIYGVDDDADVRLADEMLTDPSKESGVYRSVVAG
jgi:diguanylate cyclase (GGDEF)-like protein